MRPRGLYFALVCTLGLVGGELATADSGAPRGDGLRSRILNQLGGAKAEQVSILWVKQGTSSTVEYRSECFRDGAACGAVLFAKQGEEWVVKQAFVTDGKLIVARRGGDFVGLRQGALPIRRLAEPWQVARQRLAKTLAHLPRRELETVISMQLENDGTGPSLKLGLEVGLILVDAAAGRAARYRWLKSEYWEQLRDVTVEKRKTARLVGDGFVLSVTLDTGLLAGGFVEETDDGSSVTGNSAEPLWSPVEWKARIAHWIDDVDPASLRELQDTSRMPLMFFEQLVDDLVTSEAEALRDGETAAATVDLILEPLALQEGRRGLHALKSQVLEDQRLKRLALESGATAAERALRAGWERQAAFSLGKAVRSRCLELLDDPRFR